MQNRFTGSPARTGRVSPGGAPHRTPGALIALDTRQHLKMFLCILVIVALFFAFPFYCQAQESTKSSFFRSEGNRSKSVLIGGVYTGESLLLITKLGYEYGHLGINIEFSNDQTREKWPDGSKGSYHLYAPALTGRLYLKPHGRGPFAEAGAAGAVASLTVRQDGRQVTWRGALPLASWGVGWRFGRRPRGWFGEMAFRSNYALRTLHLYTDAAAPEESKAGTIAYQSWYLQKGKAYPQLYVGIGYSF